MNDCLEKFQATDDPGGHQTTLVAQGQPAENLWKGDSSSSVSFSADRFSVSLVCESVGANCPRQSETERRLSVESVSVDADCCGALGCVESEELVKVKKNGKERVLCEDHGQEWSR